MMNKNKKAKNNVKNSSFPQRGEIWVIDYNYKPSKEEIDKNDFMIENDIKKHRPSLVLSNNTQNKYDEEIIVAPTSSQELEEIQPFEVFIPANEENGLEKNSKILLNRLRAVERIRLRNFVGKVDKETMMKVKEALDIVLWRYQIEVPLYGHDKEKAKKELDNVDNSPLKQAMKENYHRIYAYQFYFSDNLYLDDLKEFMIHEELSENGKVAIARKYDKKGKIHYIPVKIRHISYYSKKKDKVREILVEYCNSQCEKLTNPDDYQIIFNNPERKGDLVEFEKDFDLLVSIQDKIQEEMVNQYPRTVLDSPRSLQEKEIEEFRKQWEEPSMFVSLPPGVNSVKDSRPPLKTEKLWERFENIRKEIDKKIENDIKENKDIKYKEREKAFKEIEKKWGIKLAINHRHNNNTKENQKENFMNQISKMDEEQKKLWKEIRATHNLRVKLMLEKSFKPTDENKKKFEENEAKLKELRKKHGGIVDKAADLLRKSGIKEKKR